MSKLLILLLSPWCSQKGLQLVSMQEVQMRVWKQLGMGNNFPVLRLDALVMALADTSNSKSPQCSGVVYNIFSSCIILLSSSFILSFSSFSLSHFIYQDPKRLLKQPFFLVFLSQCLSMRSQTRHTCLDVSLRFWAVSFYLQWYQMRWVKEWCKNRGSNRTELTAIQFLQVAYGSLNFWILKTNSNNPQDMSELSPGIYLPFLHQSSISTKNRQNRNN